MYESLDRAIEDCNLPLHEKPYFLFPNVLKTWSFQKNYTGIWSFFYYQEKILFLDTKGEMIFLKKNTWKYDIYFRCSGKIVFPGNSGLNTIFFVISGKMVFIFSRKYDNFSLGEKWKMIFIKKRMEIWYFLYICVGVTSTTLAPRQRNKDALAPKKYT